MRHELRTGTIVKLKANPNPGANESRIAKVRMSNGKTVLAVAKPDQSTFDSSSTRAAAVSHLADALGPRFDFVPPTVQRTIDGTTWSFQYMLTGRGRSAWRRQSDLKSKVPHKLDRARGELLRVFDFIIGNSDRKPDNTFVKLKKGAFRPGAIDNDDGLDGAKDWYFKWPLGLTSEEHFGELLPETIGAIQAIDVKTVAKALRASGIDARATKLALLRIEQLKQDPSFLELHPDVGTLEPSPIDEAVPSVPLTSMKPRDGAFLQEIGLKLSHPKEGLPSATRKRIDRIIEALDFPD